MEGGCKITEDQAAQGDWYRIDKSRYCPECGEWKKIVKYEKNWGEKHVKLEEQ